jgi:hypothetical protein
MNSYKSMTLTIVIVLTAFLSGPAQAGKPGGSQREFVTWSGFEGQEQMLGAAVAGTIMEVAPAGFRSASAKGQDFSDPIQQQRLGYAVSTAIRTIRTDEPYMHEMNDALVKMTLTYIQFAKDHDLLDDLIATEMRTQFPMLSRVGKVIEKTGNPELALLAITDRTTCFYQLVDDAERERGQVTYRSPFANVLKQTVPMGQHDLTLQEIHEIWTIPRIRGQAEIMGVDIQVSEWRDDGTVTISVPQAMMAKADDQ